MALATFLEEAAHHGGFVPHTYDPPTPAPGEFRADNAPECAWLPPPEEEEEDDQDGGSGGEEEEEDDGDDDEGDGDDDEDDEDDEDSSSGTGTVSIGTLQIPCGNKVNQKNWEPCKGNAKKKKPGGG